MVVVVSFHSDCQLMSSISDATLFKYSDHISGRDSCVLNEANQVSFNSTSPRSISCQAPVSWGPF